ncbi:hypothetical protein ABPG74_004702 [Tetrahymena malaccensis]
MDQIYTNGCQLDGHYGMQKDQICMDDSCQYQKMCLYCRIQHNQNHMIIPIKQLINKVAQMQNPIEIKNRHYNKIVEMFNQIQKKVNIYIDNQLDQTNFFKEYPKFQESNIKLQEADVLNLNQASMKLLMKILNFYEEDFVKKSFLIEDNKQKIVEALSDLFIQMNNQNFKQENIQKGQDQIFEEIFNQSQIELEQQYENVEQLQKSNKQLQIQIDQLEKQIKQKDNLHNDYVQKQESEIKNLLLQINQSQSQIKDLDQHVLDLQNEKIAMEIQLKEVHKYSVDAILLIQHSQFKLEFENKLQEQIKINQQQEKELIKKHKQSLEEHVKKIQQKDEEIQSLQKLIEDQEFQDILFLKIQKNIENKELQSFQKKQKNLQIIQQAKYSINNIVSHFKLSQN